MINVLIGEHRANGLPINSNVWIGTKRSTPRKTHTAWWRRRSAKNVEARDIAMRMVQAEVLPSEP